MPSIAVALAALAAMPTAAAADPPGLRELTRRPLAGSAVDAKALAGEPDYAAVLAREFGVVTPENAMKWKYVEPQEGVTDYTQADQIADFAAAHGQLVRGHTLVWHNALPAWLTQRGFSAAELEAILQRHVTDEVAHFRGRVSVWDVVNEPVNADGTWRRSLWYGAMGEDYVAAALRWAHAADPAAGLYINEYDAEAIGPRSDALFALVSRLRAAGVPIDGVGFQAHLDIADPFPSELQANLQRFADLGVDVAITEADVRIPVPATPESLAVQADYFGRLAQACVAVARCASFTVWEFTDRHSWVPYAYAHEGGGDPVRRGPVAQAGVLRDSRRPHSAAPRRPPRRSRARPRRARRRSSPVLRGTRPVVKKRACCRRARHHRHRVTCSKRRSRRTVRPRGGAPAWIGSASGMTALMPEANRR